VRSSSPLAYGAGVPPPFVFVVTNVATAPLAKREVLSARPEARFAFSRPGLLTFKLADASPTFGEGLVFARVAGQSLGNAEGLEELVALVPEAQRESAAWHVFARDPEDAGSVARASSLRSALAPRGFDKVVPGQTERVIDVVVAQGEPLFVGQHVHGPGRWSLAGGLPDVEVPELSPSRAFAKLEEALAWSGLSPRQGTEVVELGASPGGATLAMLRRGWSVVAFDPGALDPRVREFVGPGEARVRFHERPAGSIGRSDLPARARLLVSDMNLAPPVALRYVARVRAMLPELEAAILTVKLNDERMLEQTSRWIELVRGMRFSDVRATQLPSHRQEMVIVARA
jgi:23S rRNA (cytidine2498-2'-O)-methyltransferase